MTSAASASSVSFSTDTPNRTLSVLEPTLLPRPESPFILGPQDAFDPSVGLLNANSSVGIIVFRDGCWLPDDTAFADCSQACTKPDLMFLNTSTIHNCVVYPAIAQYLLAVGQNETIDSSVTFLVQNLANLGYRNDTLDSSPAIDQCFQDYCNDTASGCNDYYFKPVFQISGVAISVPCHEMQLQNISCFFFRYLSQNRFSSKSRYRRSRSMVLSMLPFY